MSTEYIVNIHRKVDNKVIGKAHANTLKTIFDSEFADLLGCSRHNADGVRFEYSTLTNIINTVNDRIKQILLKNSIRKFQIALATSVEIKEQLERDNEEYQTYIDEDLNYVIQAAARMQGLISCIAEDMIDLTTDESAYNYNGKDLPKKKSNYGEISKTIWENDVYCVIKAC